MALPEIETSCTESNSSIRFARGAAAAFPIMLGYLPIGIAFGALAVQSGIKISDAALMSIIVFAGSSQFIAVSLIGSGAGLAALVGTTFLVNARHVLMSASLSTKLAGMNKRRLAVLAFGITDESFALHSAKLAREPAEFWFMLGLNTAAYLSWVGSTLIGAALAGRIGTVAGLGFEFALPAMFISLLLIQLESFRSLVVAIVSGGVSLLLYLLIPGTWNVIIAAMTGATLGLLIDSAGLLPHKAAPDSASHAGNEPKG